MCFSMEASLVGGVIISAIGVVTVKKVHKSSQILFASIPLFFGLQQFAEGFLWYSLPNPDLQTIQNISAYTFVIMAQVIWPLLIPLSVLVMEKSAKKKKILYIMFAFGVVLALYYSFCLISFTISPQIMGYHIKYFNSFPMSLAKPAFLFYLIATIPPFFVSSIKRMKLMGYLMTGSCVVTVIFFTQYLTSVWCFFAALLSGVIYWILNDSRRAFNLEKLRLLTQPIKDLLK